MARWFALGVRVQVGQAREIVRVADEFMRRAVVRVPVIAHGCDEHFRPERPQQGDQLLLLLARVGDLAVLELRAFAAFHAQNLRGHPRLLRPLGGGAPRRQFPLGEVQDAHRIPLRHHLVDETSDPDFRIVRMGAHDQYVHRCHSSTSCCWKDPMSISSSRRATKPQPCSNRNETTVYTRSWGFRHGTSDR